MFQEFNTKPVTLQYVEVIIPLAVPGTFTYLLPEEFSKMVTVGCRVSVQFGKNKIYAGIVNKIHTQTPEYRTKPILAVLDEFPIVYPQQLSFWEWISQYYACYVGEVMNAALPIGLKLSSETKVVVNDAFDGDISLLTSKELAITDALTQYGELTIQQISKILNQQKVIHIIRGLIDKKVVSISEEMENRYKPKVEEFITISEPYCLSELELSQLLDSLNEKKQTYKQMLTLMGFVKLCNGDYQKEILKSQLVKEFECSPSSVASLIRKNIFITTQKEVSRLKQYESELYTDKIEYSAPQTQVIDEISEAFASKDIALLHGVTGSGKTEIYIHFIKAALERGEQVLYLLPEIALTGQIVGRLQYYFGDQVGVYHSKFNEYEQVEIWNAVLNPGQDNSSKKFSIIIGARSAVFLPFSNLGLVIIDEEHDSSYKQIDPAPRYHARDTALYLASLHKAKTILGSATPSVETYWNTQKGKYALVELNTRFSNVELPETLIVNLQDAHKLKKMKSMFSDTLVEHITEALARNEQIILFQNRRGFSPIIECQKCLHVPKCIRCDVSLTYHKKIDAMKCHYCGYTIPSIHVCPVCSSSDLKAKGLGTEKIEEELALLFPHIHISRVDQDTSGSKYALQKILSDFELQKIHILVGTQMITKGLDFSNVSLVGVINADSLISYPDFRSFERAFQLLVQVSGRSGRKEKRGKVIIQTYNPTNAVIEYVTHNNYQGMYQQQIAERKSFNYPPFVRLIKIVVKHTNAKTVVSAARHLTDLLRKSIPDQILGPEYPMISMINNYHLNEIYIKIDMNSGLAEKKARIGMLIDQVNHHLAYKGVRFSVDVDPQ
jgi:primosomal protein N' (replication factor Y) (superfamily II helicase)